MDKDKLLQKYRNMKQYSAYTEEELIQLVDKKIQEEELLTAFIGLGDDEAKKAIKLYDQYVTEGSFESLAEKSTLINLVRDELLKERVLMQIKDEHDNKNEANSLRLFEEVRELEKHILEQKEKLGMLRNKTNESGLELMNELKEKALNYYKTHAGCTTVKCPYCQQLFNLLMDVTNLEPSKATMFLGTILYNVPLLNLYHQKRITTEEFSEIMGVHTNYITFIYQNLYLRKSDESK